VATSLAPTPSAPKPLKPPRSRRRRWPFLVALGAVVAAAVAFFGAVVEWSGATLAGDGSALARVEVQTFGGKLESARAVDPQGHAIKVGVVAGRLTPEQKITPGTQVTVEVVMRRPGWDAWLIGKTRVERLQVDAPVAQVTSKWVTATAGEPVKVAFSQPVTTVAYGDDSKTVAGVRTSVGITTPAPAGSVRVAVAARSWESLGPPATVHYFPRMKRPAALITPSPGGKLDPGDQLRITFSQSVRQVLGSKTTAPKLTPSIPGHWRKTDVHTLVFTPSGLGAPLGSHVQLTFPHTVAAADATGHGAKTTRTINWTVPPAQPLRLVQLLADTGYLPVDYKISGGGPKVAHTARAQASAAADPPKGHFAWRYKHTPTELKHQWAPTTTNVITRGAIMMFEDEHHMTTDGVVGPALWKALLADAIAGKRRSAGYSYVFVHRNVPQLMSLWHNGHVIVTSPGNTGIPSAPTDLGTFPVFEHLAVTTMSGTNPDGTKYNDPGIKWVSYFNGGDALHQFNRASFGTPQSLGCVELPGAAAEKIWPYTPIGTLVTIEN
jgi:hypothetical protein